MFSPILRGRRLLELQKCRSLSVPMTLFQKASAFSESFSSATAVKSEDDGRGRKIAVSYLVDSCGLTPELAESISRKVSFEESDNLLRVLNLLRRHEFTNSQICRIIRTYPRLLLVDAEKSLGPKLEFLQSRGASGSELCEIVSKVPRILGKRGNNSLSRCYDFLKDILVNKEEEADKSSKDEGFHPALAQGAQKNIVRNISVLRQLGVPRHSLSRMLITYPGPVSGKERFEESVKKVVEMGFDPATSKFTTALVVVYEMSDKTIQEKVEIFKRWGFSEGEIWAVFKKRPFCLKYSEKKISGVFEALKRCGLVEDEVRAVFKKYPECIRYSEQKIANSVETLISLGFTRDEAALILKRHPQCIGSSPDTLKEKTEFVVKKMGWPLEAVCAAPAVLGYSLEKRTLPRCQVIRALISKGVIKETPSMATVVSSSPRAFLKAYVLKHLEDLPELIHFFPTGKSHSEAEPPPPRLALLFHR